jgi:tetratricopeptide (TPR) repeat protein
MINKKIKLFLTSSFQGLEKDVTELSAFVGDLNDRYESQGIYFSLHVSGQGEMKEDIEAAENSELFYIIFHDEPQDRAKAEFEAAYTAFREKKTPKILTYYKQFEGDSPRQSALAFMDKLRNELEHFNSKYTHMDTIKLNVVLQLKALGLEHVKIDVEGSSIILDDKKLTTLTLDNVPMIFNNKNLAVLKEEYARLEKEYWLLREQVRKDPDDEESLDAYSDVSRRRKKIEKTIYSLQMNVITTATSLLEKDGTGIYSQRYMLARQCLEEGDIEGADQALNEDELEQEEALEQEKAAEEKKVRQAIVENRLLRVNVLKMQIENPNRFAEIEHNFETAIKLEKDWGLERKTLGLYAIYLHKRSVDFQKALKYAQLYLHWIKSEDKEESEIALVCSFIVEYGRNGICGLLDNPDKINNLTKAIELAKDNVDFYRFRAQIYEHDRNYFDDAIKDITKCIKLEEEENIADYSWRANVFLRKKDYDNAIKDITKCIELKKENVSDYYYWRGRVYYYKKDHDNAIKDFTKCIELSGSEVCDMLINIPKNLLTKEMCVLAAQKDRRAFKYIPKNLKMELRYVEDINEEFSLSQEDISWNIFLILDDKALNAALDYCDFMLKYAPEQVVDRISSYLSSNFIEEIEEKIRLSSPEKLCDVENEWKKLIATVPEHLALRYKSNSHKEAENNYIGVLSIYERLAVKNPTTFEPALATNYDILAKLYRTTQRYSESEELYKKMIAIYERLVAKEPASFDPKLANTCNDLAILYETNQRYTDAEELFKKSLIIYERRAGVSKLPNLAVACSNLAYLYDTTQRYSDAEELYKKALVIRERLAVEHPAVFEPDLAQSCDNLAELYKTTQRNAEAELLYQKAANIYERLSTENPTTYDDSYNTTLFNLVNLLHDMGKYDEAEHFYHKLISLRERLAKNNLEKYEGQLALALNNFGSMYRKIESFTEAELLYNRALVIRKKLITENPNDNGCKNNLATQLYRLGLLHEQTNRLPQAQEYWQQAFDIWESMNKDSIGDNMKFLEEIQTKMSKLKPNKDSIQ